MYVNTFFRSSLVILLMSGWISVSPFGRMPSFGFAGAADAFVDTGLREHAAATRIKDATTKKRRRINILLCRRELISFRERLVRPGRQLDVRAPARGKVAIGGVRGDVCRREIRSARVGNAVGAIFVQEPQHDVRRADQGVLFERRGGARELEVAVDIADRDVGANR